MSAVTPIRSDEQPFFIVSPAGDRVKVPAELFALLKEFVDGKKCGSARLTFQTGGIAGIETTQKLK